MGKASKELNEKLNNHQSGQSNDPISGPAHTLSFDDVVKELNSSAIDGLTPEEAKKRLDQYGKNELDNGPGVNPVRILVRQIANAMMLVSSVVYIRARTPRLIAPGAFLGHGRVFWNWFLH
jgi:magnesium-transporting ATPase (P-type)